MLQCYKIIPNWIIKQNIQAHCALKYTSMKKNNRSPLYSFHISLLLGAAPPSLSDKYNPPQVEACCLMPRQHLQVDLWPLHICKRVRWPGRLQSPAASCPQGGSRNIPSIHRWFHREARCLYLMECKENAIQAKVQCDPKLTL